MLDEEDNGFPRVFFKVKREVVLLDEGNPKRRITQAKAARTERSWVARREGSRRMGFPKSVSCLGMFE
jgi:hypothetical protein